MIKEVVNKSHGIVIITMAGLFAQNNWIFNGVKNVNQFQKDSIEYQLAHFVNFSISGFFFPITTSVLLSSLFILRQYNNYIDYDNKKQKYFEYGQSAIIGVTSLLGLSVPCRYILLNKHR